MIAPDFRLLASSHVLGLTPLSTVLLKNDQRFFWVMLVPHCGVYSEIFDLPQETYALFMQEVRTVAQTIKTYRKAHKINVETLGNIVPMLHVHIIARHENDVCWPQPIWVHTGEAIPYPEQDVQRHRDILGKQLHLRIES